MRKLLASLAGVVVAAAALGACNANFQATAAHVDGHVISEHRLDEMLSAIASDSDYRCVLSGQGGGLVVEGVGQGTYATSFAASILTTLVEERALARMLAAEHLAVTPFARTIAIQALGSQLSPPQGSACTSTGTAVLAGLPSTYRRFVVNLQAEQAVLLARAAGVELTVAGVRRYAASHPGATTLACVSAIEVATKAEAVSITRQMKAGASFAALAKRYSLDAASASNGGALGCVLPGQLAASLGPIVAHLAVGAVSAPIPFGSNVVLFQVTSRKPAPPVQVAEVALESVAASDPGIVRAALRRAKVGVDPRYGRWAEVTGTFQVVPPAGPASPLLGNPGAVTPTAASGTTGVG